MTPKLKKSACEICGLRNKAALHFHHIIPRVHSECTNHSFNLVCVCANCHNLIHHEEIKIIGIWPSSNPRTKRLVVFKRNGICNIPELENEPPPYTSIAPRMKVHGE